MPGARIATARFRTAPTEFTTAVGPAIGAGRPVVTSVPEPATIGVTTPRAIVGPAEPAPATVATVRTTAPFIGRTARTATTTVATAEIAPAAVPAAEIAAVLTVRPVRPVPISSAMWAAPAPAGRTLETTAPVVATTETSAALAAATLATAESAGAIATALEAATRAALVALVAFGIAAGALRTTVAPEAPTGTAPEATRSIAALIAGAGPLRGPAATAEGLPTVVLLRHGCSLSLFLPGTVSARHRAEY